MINFYILGIYILAYIGLFGISFYILSLRADKKQKKISESATDKTVTIIIPAYNERKGIAATIESAKALDYPKEKLQIIVVDDGSTDDTYSIAKKYISNKHPLISVYTKKNGGKSAALNFGISKTNTEIIVSMDADTYAEADSLKKMIAQFNDDQVMSVTPSMGVYKPRNVWQRVQQIEYYISVFVRKSFATVNAIHITPGAFSAYRRAFFTQYGGYDEDDITEDLEIALRIQSHDYIIRNASQASVHTEAPARFKELLQQRKRWYTGLIRGLWKYRRLFNPKKGALGTIVLPIAVSTVGLAIILSLYLTIKAGAELHKEIISLNAIDFKFSNIIEFNSFLFTHFFYSIFSQRIVLITILFVSLTGFYLAYSRRQMKYVDKTRFNFILFIIFYSFLFTFWWIVSLVYVIINREVVWKKKN